MAQEMYSPKGRMVCAYIDGEAKFTIIENSEFYKLTLKYDPSFIPENPIYHHMSGKDFYLSVDSGCFIDYDGSIANVYVDGYECNVGLTHKGITQGGFLLGKKDWLEFCEQHEVIVNWANR